MLYTILGHIQGRAASEGSIEAYPYAAEPHEDSLDETSDPDANGHHPHFDRAIMRSRRKSVSFAVCKVNPDTMQFDLEHKSVLLGNMSASSNNQGPLGTNRKSSGGNRPPASPLRQVARKWRDAKNKLVLKDKVANVFLGSVGKKDPLELTDETFRNRRRELMEKAKALEEAAAKAKRKGSNTSMRDIQVQDPKNDNESTAI